MLAALALLATLGIAPLPPDIRMSVTDRSLLLASRGHIVSTALVCPGYRFVEFGIGGPELSPDQHWVLVDVLGPFAPANVARRHALVNVRTGRIVYPRDFPPSLGIPTSTDVLAWASGERSTLRYADGTTHALVDPPQRFPTGERCLPLPT